MKWFVDNRPELKSTVARMETGGIGERRLLGGGLAEPPAPRPAARLLDQDEFLGPYGMRAALALPPRSIPTRSTVDGDVSRRRYEPAESPSGLFGGNSNWRGPVWFPINYLLIESLQKFHYYLGDGFTVEVPTGSSHCGSLWEASNELSHRLIDIFERDDDGRRAVFGGNALFQNDPHWCDLIPFYEYFHGDNGAGIGASHQTGWTALVAKLLQQCAEYCGTGKDPLRASSVTNRGVAEALH